MPEGCDSGCRGCSSQPASTAKPCNGLMFSYDTPGIPRQVSTGEGAQMPSDFSLLPSRVQPARARLRNAAYHGPSYTL